MHIGPTLATSGGTDRGSATGAQNRNVGHSSNDSATMAVPLASSLVSLLLHTLSKGKIVRKYYASAYAIKSSHTCAPCSYNTGIIQPHKQN